MTPNDPESLAKEIEQLLTRAMGPMAKILLGRARKKGGDDQAILDNVAGYIQDEGERAKFLDAARKKISAGATLAIAPGAGAGDVPTSEIRVPQKDPVTESRPRPEPVMKPGAIFVSYARDNLEIARRLVEALRAAGLEVWLDMGQLQPGDAWDLKIRRNIEACSFFIPLISRETDARTEGYFRREWNIAADRMLNFADDVPFLLPVTIDDTPAYSARVPERFRGAHWTALPGGQATPEFVDHVRQLVDDYRSRHSSA